MSELNTFENAYLESLPIEMFPGYRPHTEPIPLHGPDYSTWTLSKLLYEGLLEVNFEGTSFVDIILKWDPNGPVLKLMLSWFKVANKTPAQYRLFPKFPFKINIDKDLNFTCE